VIFLREIQNEHITPYYHACDLFVLPSVARSEAFGIVQIEAMAAGKPVVNTKLDSGVPFVSQDGLTGLTVEPSNAPALADAINRLLDNPDLREKLGAQAFRRAQQEFSMQTMTARVLSLYNQVVGQPEGMSKELMHQ
jgi:rhamnosyl/mannosyltransferase